MMNLRKWFRMMHEARLKAQRDQWAIEDAIKVDSWNEGWSEGREQGIAIGEISGSLYRSRQVILDLLEDLGDIPEDIQRRICTEEDADILRKWLKLSARAESMEDFKIQMD